MQLRQCCQAQNCSVFREYEDHDTSRKAERTAFQQMLWDAAAKVVGIAPRVIVKLVPDRQLHLYIDDGFHIVDNGHQMLWPGLLEVFRFKTR
jgi:hypothetical protein